MFFFQMDKEQQPAKTVQEALNEVEIQPMNPEEADRQLLSLRAKICIAQDQLIRQKDEAASFIHRVCMRDLDFDQKASRIHFYRSKVASQGLYGDSGNLGHHIGDMVSACLKYKNGRINYLRHKAQADALQLEIHQLKAKERDLVLAKQLWLKKNKK